ncbi:hypothetical protein vBDshSR4C_028 [Dinoroseobacter phage vB_DshS-R4C]|nr:hypothetical protein vBDshSR4C_028 [Dinoroseobacter phage vB_DshS-R4C]
MITRTTVTATLALTLAACNPDAPERVGYFKSDYGNRVMAYHTPAPMPPGAAGEFLSRAMHTPGQLTIAAIYVGDTPAPGDILTTAPDYLTAADLLFAPDFMGWTCRAVRNPVGEVSLFGEC